MIQSRNGRPLARYFPELRFPSGQYVLDGAASAPVDVTPMTTTPEEAEPWLRSGEGVVAKDLGASYRPGERKGMVKIKRQRTIDAVVVGYRPGKEQATVGSLILGLYDK